ncbi:hypothetical protein BH18CHL2_BH18CHL2_12720 [soil metagenome]
MLRRVAAVHDLWRRGVADLTVAQVNHVERPGVLPIAFTLVHCVRAEDVSAATLLDAGSPLWDEHVQRIGHRGVLPERGTPVADAEQVRIGDMDAWRAYQQAAFERTERALAALQPERLDDVMFEVRRPAGLAGGFLAAYVPDGEIHRGEVIEAWIFQHASRHLGELEHARALVGLNGLT